MRNRLHISGQTRLYCLIGDPVSHSLSPFIMNRGFETLGMDCVYTAFRVTRDGLGEALAGLRAIGAAGANVTYPHKEAVLSFINQTSDPVDVVHAANTLRFTENGTHAYNTDAEGTAVALETFGGLSLKDKKVLIFGAGGAARAAAFGVLSAGASTVAFCVRNLSKAREAVSDLRRLLGNGSISLISMTDNQPRVPREAAVTQSDILINATPSSSPVEDPGWIQPGQYCFDFTYHRGETPFLRQAWERGALCLSGHCLLVAQALGSFRCWTGCAFDLEEMTRALESHTGERIISWKE